MGGAWFHTICGSAGAVTEEALLSRATEAVRAHLHVTAAPIWSHVRIQKVEPVFSLLHGLCAKVVISNSS